MDTLGHVTMFAGNYAPRNWAFCAGQVLPIKGNEELHAVIGSTYGGDAETFALPDMRGRSGVGTGTGGGLAKMSAGDSGGTDAMTLSVEQLPEHNHAFQCNTDDAFDTGPENNLLGYNSDFENPQYISPNGNYVHMADECIAITGEGAPINIRNPHLGISHIICVAGVFPQRESSAPK